MVPIATAGDLHDGAQGDVGAGEPPEPDTKKLLEMLVDQAEERLILSCTRCQAKRRIEPEVSMRKMMYSRSTGIPPLARRGGRSNGLRA